MSLTPIRVSVPVKGWNTIMPIREMGHEYAPRLENVWFDQSGAMNRRPGQVLADSVLIGSPIELLFEYRAVTSLRELFCWAANGNIYKLVGTQWAQDTTISGVFINRPTIGQIQGQLVLGDGSQVRYYNGTTWATPIGASPMKFFTAYGGRMVGAGNPVKRTEVYYSDTIAGAGLGAADWTMTGPGGVFDISGEVGIGEEITGLATYQGMVVVFCRNNIVFINNLGLAGESVQKVIKGIGCISHDSIQGIGNDVIFLSRYGFKTLKEVLVQGDAAADNNSVPINNFVVDELLNGNVVEQNIRSAFAEKFGVYLCTFGNTTLAYHVLFDSWVPWYGVQPTLFTTLAGEVYAAGNRLYKFDSAATYDNTDVAGQVAIPMVWETPPFRAGNTEVKSRWNRVEIIYQSPANEPLTVRTWINLDEATAETHTITLSPSVATTTPTDMIWSGAASNDPRRAWGTATTGPSWAGGVNFLSGDHRLPVRGRAELFSVRITNDNMSRFKVTALEVYFNAGGLR